MESEEKVEMIKKAIIKLMDEEEEEEDINTANTEDEDNRNSAASRRRRQLLNKLLCELDLLEEEEKAGPESESESDIIIIKELKEVKTQNSITHYLLVAMILITVGWQLSEVSLILKIKDGLRNPFKSLGGMLKGFLKGQDAIKAAASDAHKHLTQQTYLPPLDFPAAFDEEDDDDDDYNY